MLYWRLKTTRQNDAEVDFYDMNKTTEARSMTTLIYWTGLQLFFLLNMLDKENGKINIDMLSQFKLYVKSIRKCWWKPWEWTEEL